MFSRIRCIILLVTWPAVLFIGGSNQSEQTIPFNADRHTKPTENACAEGCRNNSHLDTDQGLVINNTATGLTARIDPKGFSLETTEPDLYSGNWSASLGLVHLGRPGHWSLPLPEAAIVQWGDSVRIGHASFDVEYINSAAGLRQNFIVHERPLGAGPLRVEMKPAGDLRCEHAGGDLFRFIDSTEVTRMTYSDLHVWDALGDTLDAWAFLEDGLVVLAVNDAEAEYPITIDPLATTAIWTTESNLANAQLGTSASSAGDVNGDGYSDILVGTPSWTNGEGGEGRVQLHYGSATGPSVGISWSFESNQVGANLGSNKSVATAGDVNGDGYSDIIVGAPYFDNGETNEGRVFVFHGSATGLSATPDWTAESNQANALFGNAVNCVGDVNGDGYSDVVVGAHQYNGGFVNEGRVFVYHGSAAGLSAVAEWTAEGDQFNVIFGYSVASAGDVNGDGFSDLIVGAPRFANGQTNEGRAFVYHGSAAGLSATANWTTESNSTNSQAGFSVSSAGDTNNDGYSDVAIGIPFYASIFASDGRVVIHRGSASGLGAVTQTIDSSVQEAQFGKALACAGDVNGDGFSDLLIGMPEYSAGTDGQGGAFMYLGGTVLTSNWSTLGGQIDAKKGTAVASAGDVNGDGFSDVIVTAPLLDNGQTNEGRAFVYLGAPGSLTILTPQVITGTTGSIFGHSVAAAGDVNGDGRSDVIVGAESLNSGRGAAYLYLGTNSGLNPTAINTWGGPVPGMLLGARVAGAGDVNGDGYSDVIIGVPWATGIGRAYIHHGSSTGASATANTTLLGTVANTRFGATLASAGDVNGDGYSDVIVGEPQWNGSAGAAYVYLGGPAGINPAPAWTAKPFDAPFVANANFGESVAGAGDVNGDGYNDVIVGAGGFNGARGRVFVFHGGPTGLSTTPNWIIDGSFAGMRLGSNPHSETQVSSLGDVNGDGFSDVAIASMGFRVFVFHGQASGLGAVPALTFLPPPGGTFFGVIATSAGDVNGDGYSDMIIANCGDGVRLYLGSPTGFVSTNADVYLGGASGPGHSSAGVGDVDGDGYSDIVAGRYTNDALSLYRGNAKAVRVRSNLRLYNTDLVSPISASNISDPQFGAGLFTHPFLGRVKNRVAWETRVQGIPFSSAGGSISNSTAFTAEEPSYSIGPLAGQEHKVFVDKIGGGAGITAHKVRARVRYDPVTAITGQVYGPWRYMPGYMNGHGTHNNIPLPVELLYFNATCDEGRARLDWATASESNSSHFIIQRSSDATTWNDIGSVPAAGQSQQVIEYTFTDPVPTKTETTYYRALQFDQDGSVQELPLVTSEPCSGNGEPRLFPNPTDGILFVDITALKTAASTLLLLDASGRIRMNVRVEGVEQQLDLSNLASGSYVLQVLDERGGTLSIEQVVKR